MSAPLTGGQHVGADRYYVDGDFSVVTAVSPPMVSNAFKGDSAASIRDIVLLNSSNVYVNVSLGSGYNIQPFRANQTAIVFEQEFVVAEQYFQPLPLNTAYYMPWSIGWDNTYVNLAACFLCEEGPLEPIGGGLVRFRRTYANLPPNRNRFESFSYVFPSLNYGDATTVRLAKPFTVNSRIQHDYFLVDQLDLQTGIPLFTSGHRLNLTTGMQPTGLILPEMRYFKGSANAVENNALIDPDQSLTDTAPATVPSYTQYATWKFIAEIVAESSVLQQWLGNIYERRTRFVIAQ